MITIFESLNRSIKLGVSSQSGVKLWSLTGLDKTYHTIKMLPSAGQFSFDYMAFTPTIYTSFTGQQVIVDDADELLKYSGNNAWSKLTNQVTESGMPYSMTLTTSSTKGSSVQFGFTGESIPNRNPIIFIYYFKMRGSTIGVYGALNQQSGTLSVEFSVDGATPTVFTPFNGSQSVDPSAWTINHRLFYQDLVPGVHSVEVVVSDVSGSQVWHFSSSSKTPQPMPTLLGPLCGLFRF